MPRDQIRCSRTGLDAGRWTRAGTTLAGRGRKVWASTQTLALAGLALTWAAQSVYSHCREWTHGAVPRLPRLRDSISEGVNNLSFWAKVDHG